MPQRTPDLFSSDKKKKKKYLAAFALATLGLGFATSRRGEALNRFFSSIFFLKNEGKKRKEKTFFFLVWIRNGNMMKFKSP